MPTHVTDSALTTTNTLMRTCKNVSSPWPWRCHFFSHDPARRTINKCNVRLPDGSWTAGSIIENFRVKKNYNFIEGERRA